MQVIEDRNVAEDCSIVIAWDDAEKRFEVYEIQNRQAQNTRTHDFYVDALADFECRTLQGCG